MKILFIGMPNSIHTQRWINQFPMDNWKVYFFPVYISNLCDFERNVIFFSSKFIYAKKNRKNVKYIKWTSLFFRIDSILRRFFHGKQNIMQILALELIIRLIKPDIIHSLETQRAGYLTLEVKKKIKTNFPKWLLSVWGSDLFLFGRLMDHREKIKSVLGSIDGLICECQRDVQIAKNLGVKVKIFTDIPATSGFDFEYIGKIKKIFPTSSRRIIALKGQQNWAGRALFGLRALSLCSECLQEYQIEIYSSSPNVMLSAELFSQDTGIPVRIIDKVSHQSVLELFSRARIALAVGISDGLPNTMTEAMIMGAFPIQSCTSCADEWIENGKNGFIVPPEDPDAIAQAIRKALLDDKLVDQAAKINFRIAQQRLDHNAIKNKTIKIYQEIMNLDN